MLGNIKPIESESRFGTRRKPKSWNQMGHIGSHPHPAWLILVVGCWWFVFFGDIQKSSQQKFPMTKTRCLLQFSENTRLLLVQWWARAANRYSKRHDGQAWIQANRCGQADLGRAKSCWNMLRSGWAIVRIREAKVTRWPETCQSCLFAWEFTSKHMKAEGLTCFCSAVIRNYKRK